MSATVIWAHCSQAALSLSVAMSGEVSHSGMKMVLGALSTRLVACAKSWNSLTRSGAAAPISCTTAAMSSAYARTAWPGRRRCRCRTKGSRIAAKSSGDKGHPCLIPEDYIKSPPQGSSKGRSAAIVVVQRADCVKCWKGESNV